MATSRPSAEPRATTIAPSLLRALAAVVLAAATAGCGEASATPVGTPPMGSFSGTAYDAAGARKLPETKPHEFPGLHNVYRLSDSIVSGSEPHDEASLRQIAEMGVKTIVSVDGKSPDAETAKKYGLRYVHIPIQYAGISDDEIRRLAKTFLELPGPFYVHCFHGKHRGPAGAAVGRVVLDRVSREEAMAEMRQWCGTSPKYEGLYRSIAKAPMPTAPELKAMKYDFPAAHRFEGFRNVMVAVSRADDELGALSARKWEIDPEHPGVDPAESAARLAQVYRDAARLDDVVARPGDFRGWLVDSEKAASDLRAALLRKAKGDEGAARDADAAFGALRQRCDACHKPYRN